MWVHPTRADAQLALSGQVGDDAKPYQERAVKGAIAKVSAGKGAEEND